MTDVNSIQYQSASSLIGDETNSSFILNQSNEPMDIGGDDGDDDDDDDDGGRDTAIKSMTNGSTKFNGHLPSSIENDTDDDRNKVDQSYHG
jgi:hypothetical protein